MLTQIWYDMINKLNFLLIIRYHISEESNFLQAITSSNKPPGKGISCPENHLIAS